MRAETDNSFPLVALHDGRPGVRTLLQVEAATPKATEAGEVNGAAVFGLLASTDVAQPCWSQKFEV